MSAKDALQSLNLKYLGLIIVMIVEKTA
jgi:hypothetical protein